VVTFWFAGAQGANQAARAQRLAERQADVYGAQGAGYGAQAAGLASDATGYGAGAAQMGQQGMGIGQRGVSAAEQGFQAQQDYQRMATSPEAQQAYMSPYMQNVVDVQTKEAFFTFSTPGITRTFVGTCNPETNFPCNGII